MHSPSRNLRAGNKSPALFWKNLFARAIYCPHAKYSLKGLGSLHNQVVQDIFFIFSGIMYLWFYKEEFVLWSVASCKWWTEWVVFIDCHILVSSAKELVDISGPRTDPWGTSDNTNIQCDKLILTLTHCCLILRKVSNHLRTFCDVESFILCSSILWSNALVNPGR